MTTYTNSKTAPESVLSLVSISIAIFTEPKKALSSIRQRGAAWLPLSIIVLSSVLLLILYYQNIDFSWVQDKLVESMKDPAERDRARQIISKKMLITSGVASTVAGIPIIFALTSLYLFAVAKIKNIEISFGKWFAFVSWTSLPSLLLLPLGVLQIFMAKNGQLEFSQVNPVTLNSLFFQIETGRNWSNLLDSFSLLTVWSLGLMILGLRDWANFSRSTSTTVIVLPYAVIYGVWAVICATSKTI